MRKLLFVLLLGLLITAAHAESGTCGDHLTWTLEDGVLLM